MSSQTIRTNNEAEDTFTSGQLGLEARSPQQQVEHVHLLMVMRLVVQQAEQQRQPELVPQSNRGQACTLC